MSVLLIYKLTVLLCAAVYGNNVFSKKQNAHHQTRPHLESADGLEGKHSKRHHAHNNTAHGNVLVTDNGLPIGTTSPKFLKDLVAAKSRSTPAEFMSVLPDLTETLLTEMGGLREEDTPVRGYIYNPHDVPLEEFIDVAFVFEKPSTVGHSEFVPPERVFENWKSNVMGYNCIILGDREIVERIKIPDWMTRYEVHSREDLIKTLLDNGITDSHFLSNIIRTLRELNQEEFSEGFSLDDAHNVLDFINTYSLASWVSDREYVFVASNQHQPPPARMVQGSSSSSGQQQLSHSVIEKHIVNLRTPALPSYFNDQSDPFQPGYDFPHSYPFPLRGGVSSVLSHGKSVGEPFHDAVTKLVSSMRDPMTGRRINNHDLSRVDTVPAGQLFSLRRDNLAFNRQLLGPAMMFFGGRSSMKLKSNYQNSAFHNYHDIISGWLMKIVIDHCGYGMKHGAPFVYKNESPASRYHLQTQEPHKPPQQQQRQLGRRLNDGLPPTAGAAAAASVLNDVSREPDDSEVVVDHINDNDEDILRRRKDRLSLLHDVRSNFTFLSDERIYTFFHEWKLNKSSLTYPTSDHCGGRVMKPECIYSEMAIDLETHPIGVEYPYFKLLSYYLRLWIQIWQTRHSFLGTTFPVASRSSYAPTVDKNTPKCAMITITHNEQQLLPVWIRYHLRHFHPSDIYILDHITEDNSTHPSKIPAGIHLSKLEGNKFAMPVLFRSNVIKLYQDRLLRAGYKCVLFSDTDEIVVPNPIKYPKGLKQYLQKFAQDPHAALYTRVTGIELGHLSYANGKPAAQEPKLDWNRSILAQRSFYALDRVYNKPLLTKVPLAYRPGFHRLYNYRLDKTVETDPDLVMFHLRSMDFDFCMAREIEKFNMTRKMEQAELNAGFASHWNSYQRDKKTGELCKYAIGCYLGEYQENVTKVFDNTGVFPMYKLEDYWKTVEL